MWPGVVLVSHWHLADYYDTIGIEIVSNCCCIGTSLASCSRVARVLAFCWLVLNACCSCIFPVVLSRSVVDSIVYWDSSDTTDGRPCRSLAGQPWGSSIEGLAGGRALGLAMALSLALSIFSTKGGQEGRRAVVVKRARKALHPLDDPSVYGPFHDPIRMHKDELGPDPPRRVAKEHRDLDLGIPPFLPNPTKERDRRRENAGPSSDLGETWSKLRSFMGNIRVPRFRRPARRRQFDPLQDQIREGAIELPFTSWPGQSGSGVLTGALVHPFYGTGSTLGLGKTRIQDLVKLVRLRPKFDQTCSDVGQAWLLWAKFGPTSA